MKYDLSKSYDQQKAKEYLSKLTEDGSKANLTKIHPKRSTDQNSYLHVLFSLWGKNFGYTMMETKCEVKHSLGYSYRKVERKGNMVDVGEVLHYHSTSKMDSKELTIFIEKFRDWSAMTCDFYLPSPAEYIEEQIYFDNEIEK